MTRLRNFFSAAGERISFSLQALAESLRQTKRVWRDIDGILLFLLMLIICFGFVFNISANGALQETLKQAGFIVFGMVACGAVSLIRVNAYNRQKGIWIACLLGVIMLIPVFIQNLNGESETPDRNLNIPFIPFNLQPSEIAKILIILLGAYLFSKYYRDVVNRSVVTTGRGWKINSRIVERYKARKGLDSNAEVERWRYLIKKSWIPCMNLCGYSAICAFLVFNNHLSGVIIIGMLTVAMMYFGRVRLRWFIMGFAFVAVLAGGICINIMNDVKGRDEAYARFADVKDEYNDGYATLSRGGEEKLSYDDCKNRADVIEVYLDHMTRYPIVKDYQIKRIYLWIDKDYNNYKIDSGSNDRDQINQALYAVASGGLLGKGAGNSLFKHWTIYEQANDEIFAVICEESGMVGALIFIALYMLLILRCLRISDNADNVFSMLVAKGVAAHIGLQVFLHIFVTLDIMPNTGISLPFVSSGGSSMVCLMIEMGLVFSVARFDCPKKTADEIIAEEKRKHGRIVY